MGKNKILYKFSYGRHDSFLRVISSKYYIRNKWFLSGMVEMKHSMYLQGYNNENKTI